MKGNVAVFVVLAAAGLGLWYLGGYVAHNADENASFNELFDAARAVRADTPLYVLPGDETAAPPGSAAPAKPAAKPQSPSTTPESAPAPAEEPETSAEAVPSGDAGDAGTVRRERGGGRARGGRCPRTRMPRAS